ncbi:MAG: hypothetical protein KGR26_08780 [Cyanobacteria bacterium REEB65]|nr:hypothetical protein [Cyanobacteria bacterium REEB65]
MGTTAPVTTPYIEPVDYAAWGLSASLDPSLVLRATVLINRYCHRPQGLGPVSYSEQIRLPFGRNRVLLSYRPVIGLVAAQGRYGYPRRSEMLDQVIPGAAILLLTTELGGPPVWEAIDISVIAIDQFSNTGEIWLPAGILLYHYTDIQITYTAGLQPQDARMDDIRQACANVALAIQQRLETGGTGTKSAKGGDRSIDYWSASLIDRDTRLILDPYRPKVMR